MSVITSSLSLARELWRFGEPELAARALQLRPEEVADIGGRIGALHLSGEVAALWPHGPRDAAYLLAVVEHLEGSARPCSRSRRLPERDLPPELQATESERWEAANQVARVVDARYAANSE